MEKLFDILGIGCTAFDELLYVDFFPEPDTKKRVLRREQHCGGLTGTALVAAARLGARCAYAGRLGLDPLSRLVEENFAREQIDVSHAPRGREYCVMHSTIVVGVKTGTRNVFTLADGLTGAHDTLPDDKVISESRVLLVDHHGVPGALRAAKIARSSGNAIVADFERNDSAQFAELLAVIDHVILSQNFARRLTGAISPGDAVRRLWNPQRAAVVVTCGADGCWCAESENKVDHLPAYRVCVVDTTGCGDVFHGAYAAGLAFGMDLHHRVRFAAASAAIKATRSGGQHGAPTRVEVDRFLSSAGG